MPDINTKDLYLVFNGMFLFNWVKRDGTSRLEVYVPLEKDGTRDTHSYHLAADVNLTSFTALPQGELTIPELRNFVGHATFDPACNLAINGGEVDLDDSPGQRYARLKLPYPDACWSASTYWVRHDTYVDGTPPKATLSPVVPDMVLDDADNLVSAIAVSEVFVARYESVALGTTLQSEKTDIRALETDQLQAFVILSIHRDGDDLEHNSLFNDLLKMKPSGNPTKYRPSATSSQLGMKAPYPRPCCLPPLPPDWLTPRAKASDSRLIRSASGQGSCDDGHRCETCC